MKVDREAARGWLALAGRRGHPDAVYNLAILDYDAEEDEDEDERATPRRLREGGRPGQHQRLHPRGLPPLPRKEVG